MQRLGRQILRLMLSGQSETKPMLDSSILQSPLPVAVIGAGPVGLAAAAELAGRGIPFIVLELGAEPAAAVREWAHVTFFSPWRFNVAGAARRLLEPTGWRIESDQLDRDPTGAELIERYLAPLARHPAIAPQLRFGLRVRSVARLGMDRVPSKGREGRPFELTVAGPDGADSRILARAVIDASGTWRTPNPAGASGVPAMGEIACANRIRAGIPDVAGAERARYAGKRILVIGSGHSAMDSILGLARLKSTAPGTVILWAMRNAPTQKTFGGGPEDQLSSRGALGERAKLAVERAGIEIIAPFRVRAFNRTTDGIAVTGETAAGERQVAAGEVIVATGFRPDFSGLSEIRLDLHPWLECPRALGPLIDPNEHSCGDVPPHGIDELAHPEPGFVIVGMKSYGRAPTFLMATGYEQVRSVVAALAGDWQAARETRLALPRTGVCEGRGQGEALAPAGGCCGGPAQSNADACCVADETTKAKGEAGCGCAAGKVPAVAQAASRSL